MCCPHAGVGQRGRGERTWGSPGGSPAPTCGMVPSSETGLQGDSSERDFLLCRAHSSPLDLLSGNLSTHPPPRVFLPTDRPTIGFQDSFPASQHLPLTPYMEPPGTPMFCCALVSPELRPREPSWFSLCPQWNHTELLAVISKRTTQKPSKQVVREPES